MKHPRDRFPHPRDQRSQPAIPSIDDGEYVFVQDMNGVIFVLPDGPHMHPKVLGGDQPANYAGDLTIRNGRIVDVTNLWGHFDSMMPTACLPSRMNLSGRVSPSNRAPSDSFLTTGRVR